jgi:hypothetical protein
VAFRAKKERLRVKDTGANERKGMTRMSRGMMTGRCNVQPEAGGGWCAEVGQGVSEAPQVHFSHRQSVPSAFRHPSGAHPPPPPTRRTSQAGVCKAAVERHGEGHRAGPPRLPMRSSGGG